MALWFASQDLHCNGQLFIVNTRDTIEMELVSSDEKKQDIETVFSPTDNSPRLLYWEPMLSGDATSRILRQRSLFIIGRPLIPEDEEFIKKVSISKDDKALLLKDLELLDISQKSLFLDLYGFSNANSAESPLLQIPDPNYLLQGNEFYQKGDYPKAIEAYSKHIQINSSDFQMYFFRGIAYAEAGKHPEAIRDYDKAIAQKEQAPPLVHMAYFNRGNSKSVLKHYPEALEDYTKAIETGPGHNDSVLHFNRANTYADLHEFEKALADYDKVTGPGRYSDVYFNKGTTLVALGRFSDALQYYEKSALESADRTKADENMSAAKRIIHRIHGCEARSHFEASGVGAEVSVVWVTIVGDHSNLKETIPFVGNAGNAGNFGGRSLPGGKGLEGKPGFVVIIRSQNGNQG